MNAKQLTIFVTAILMAFVAPHAYADSAFSANELETIKAFYRDSQSRGGGKRGGRDGLPPGIAKNLERGKALPPGLSTAPLPDALDASLPPAPDGYERIVVDAKILLIETATRLVADVVADAILN